MIWESSYWKDPLIKYSEKLEKIKKRKTLSDKARAEIERKVILGFYSIRKLLESESKITDKTRNIKIKVEKYRNQKINRINSLNSHKINELFDLENSTPVLKKLLYMSNQFIHSYIFQIVVDKNEKLEGVFVSSDRVRNEELYYVKIDYIISIFKKIGKDYPSKTSYSRNKNGDFVIDRCE